jgi:LysR family transcriptional regulator, glycine cleavage system transcriptional activator
MDPEALPPLNALRAFEAAARLGSFAKAAAELHVTHWAIGKQVRLLEDWMGMPLFWRRSRGIDLTEEGAELAKDVASVCSQISRPRQKNYGMRRVRSACQGSSELTYLRALLFAGLFLDCPSFGTSSQM